jgi:hypothetical protein
MGFVIAAFRFKLATLLPAAWSRISPKPTPEQILAAVLASNQWLTQNWILQLVTLPAERARRRILDSTFEDQHCFTETVALVRRIAVEEHDHPFIRSFEECTGRPIALKMQLVKALSAIAHGQAAALRDLEIKILTSARLANDRLNASQRDALADAILAISEARTSSSDENDLACAIRVDTTITTLERSRQSPARPGGKPPGPKRV